MSVGGIDSGPGGVNSIGWKTWLLPGKKSEALKQVPYF
jgi:hypothetical protein